MSSQSIEKVGIIVLDFEIYKENSINFNKIIIPFSEFGRSKSSVYLYKGNEKINFEERHPIYKSIFLEEFTE